MGAVADGTTDNTAVFQKALDAAGQAGGGIVEAPVGRYCIKGTLSIPRGVTLQGTYRMPPTRGNMTDKPDGTILLAYAGRGAGRAALYPPCRRQLRRGRIGGRVSRMETIRRAAGPLSAVRGVTSIRRTWASSIAVFSIPMRPSSWCAPIATWFAMSPAIPANAASMSTAVMDIGHIENVHFWPFGVAYRADDPYCKWVNTQGWHSSWLAPIGIMFSTRFASGTASDTSSRNRRWAAPMAISWGWGPIRCRRAVLVEQAQPPGLLITNGEFVGRWSSTDSVCVESRSERGRQSEPGELFFLGTDRSLHLDGRTAPELIFGGLWEYDPAPETADPKLKARYELFINGEFVAPRSGKYFDSINPANEQKLAELALGGAADVDAAYAAAARAFESDVGQDARAGARQISLSRGPAAAGPRARVRGGRDDGQREADQGDARLRRADVPRRTSSTTAAGPTSWTTWRRAAGWRRSAWSAR